MQCRKCKKDFIPAEWKIRKNDWICDPCLRQHLKEWRARRKLSGNPVISTKMPPSYHAEYSKEYSKIPRVKKRRAELMRSYRNNPEIRHKHMARWITNRAIATGKLRKDKCAMCGSSKTEAHHDDYYKPLDVIWLCHACHRKHHAKATGE